MRLKSLLATLALPAALLFPHAALAQSVSCTTLFANGPMPMTTCDGPSGSVSCTTLFADGPMPMTDCSTPAGSVNCTTLFADGPMPMTNCNGSGLATPQPAPVYTAPPAPVYVAPPAAAPQPDPGLYYSDDSGHVAYLPQGAFVKAVGAPAIYVVSYGQVHAFGTWEQFLRWGGRSDLSNVHVYSHIAPSLIGQPVTG